MNARRAIRRLLSLLELFQRRHYHRQQLRKLDARTIRDVGLDIRQVSLEVQKPFWRA